MKRSKKSRNKVIVREDQNVKSIGMLEYGRYAMKLYGAEVIEERALPDFRDGLKPVQRRILWSMFKQGLKPNTSHEKSARTVGDVLAKYHPHGDVSVYGTMVTMANAPMPMVDGKGNWGGPFDPAAAYRYTNARLSRYSWEVFFNAHFTNVTTMVPNFDDKEVEPLILNSLLPNILVNGSFGIGVAVTASIPSYKVEGLAKVVAKVLSGTPCNPKMCVKHLEFNSPFGGEAQTDEKDLIDFYKTGQGSVSFVSDMTFNEETREITLKGMAPGVNVPKGLEKLRDNKAVDRVLDDTSIENGYRWRIKLSKSLPRVSVKEEVEKICKVFDSTLNFKINITERLLNAKGDPDVKFRNTNVPELINDWVKWRVETELKSLQYQRDQTAKEIAYTRLLILASVNRKVVIAALEKDDPAKYLMKALKISEQDANVILDLKVRMLSKLDQAKMQDKLKSLLAHDKTLSAHMKNPQAKITTDLQEMIRVITKGDKK